MTIFVLGYKGMLGRYVYTYLKSKGYNVGGISRTEMFVNNTFYNTSGIEAGEYDEHELTAAIHYRGIKPNDVIINCIGTIKPMVDKHGTLNAIQINSVFPHLLARVCAERQIKLIHITTDCVFSGKDGNYNENAPHDCLDVYGKTKSLGEPENCTIVRTSIIGDEVGSNKSLIEWVKSMSGQQVNGFVNHSWNGLTCLQVAKVFEDIIVNNKYWQGVRHIISPRPVSKYELVCIITEEYQLSIQVIPAEAAVPCNRTLSTIHSDITFDIPDIRDQIREQLVYQPELMSEEHFTRK